jgi:hypothetical protein
MLVKGFWGSVKGLRDRWRGYGTEEGIVGGVMGGTRGVRIVEGVLGSVQGAWDQ